MRTRIIYFVAIVQTILLLLHAFVYATWTAFQPTPSAALIPHLGLVFVFLPISFVTASLLAWRFSQWPVRLYYQAAAIWLGFFNFFFLAACACWILYGFARVLRLSWSQSQISWATFVVALIVGMLGMLNSTVLRVRRVPVKMENLPASWRGRVAALITDTHLGHVRGAGFARWIVGIVSAFKPDLVLIAGDFYDGTTADFRAFAEPLRALSPPHGTYFIAGNHEQFGDDTKYLEAISAAGVRVLNNEKVILDGLQLVGVHFRDASHPDRLRPILQNAALDPNVASILLTHAPDQLAVAAEAGISLQVNGHTHGGQFFPFTILTNRIYGAFVYGLNRLGRMLVYTSYGAGTWGPPFRVGTHPEIALLTFE
jgi:predicted MPP superfamily phosphohydrolase